MDHIDEYIAHLQEKIARQEAELAEMENIEMQKPSRYKQRQQKNFILDKIANHDRGKGLLPSHELEAGLSLRWSLSRISSIYNEERRSCLCSNAWPTVGLLANGHDKPSALLVLGAG